MNKFTLLFYRLIVLFSLKFGASCLWFQFGIVVLAYNMKLRCYSSVSSRPRDPKYFEPDVRQ